MESWGRGGREDPYQWGYDPYAMPYPPFYYPFPPPPPDMYPPQPQWPAKNDKRQQRDFPYGQEFDYAQEGQFYPSGRPPRMYPYQPWGYPMYPPHGYPPVPPPSGKGGYPHGGHGGAPHGSHGGAPQVPSSTAHEDHSEDFDQKGELPQQVGASVLEDEASPPRASHKKPHQAAVPSNAGLSATHQRPRFAKAAQQSAPQPETVVLEEQAVRGPNSKPSFAQAAPVDIQPKSSEQIEEPKPRRPAQPAKSQNVAREKPKTPTPSAAVPIPAPAPAAPKPNSWSARVGTGAAPAAPLPVVNKVGGPQKDDKTSSTSASTKEPEKAKDEKKDRVLGRKSAPVRPRPGAGAAPATEKEESEAADAPAEAAPKQEIQEAAPVESDGWQSAPAKPRRGNARARKPDQ